DVPAGDLHQADGRRADFSDPAEIVAEHSLNDVFDPEWIAAQDVPVLAFIEVSQEGVGAVGKTNLANADQSFVGGQLHEGKVPPGAAHDGQGELGDFHQMFLGARRALLKLMKGAALGNHGALACCDWYFQLE